MSDILKRFGAVAEAQFNKQQTQGAWANSPAQLYKYLEIDNRGDVGENFIASLLRDLGYEVEVDNTTDRAQKHWDVLVNKKVRLEVKTASIGAKKTFQHESIERNRNYDILVLVDVAPTALYLTLAPKNTLPFTTKSNLWTKNKKAMHRRDYGSHYKWTLSLADVEAREVKTMTDAKNAFVKVFASFGV